MDKVTFALERVRRTFNVDELMAAGEILAAEVERLREVTRGDGGRIFALQAEVERLREIEKAAQELIADNESTPFLTREVKALCVALAVNR
jgi:hypothetical protein